MDSDSVTRKVTKKSIHNVCSLNKTFHENAAILRTEPVSYFLWWWGESLKSRASLEAVKTSTVTPTFLPLFLSMRRGVIFHLLCYVNPIYWLTWRTHKFKKDTAEQSHHRHANTHQLLRVCDVVIMLSSCKWTYSELVHYSAVGSYHTRESDWLNSAAPCAPAPFSLSSLTPPPPPPPLTPLSSPPLPTNGHEDSSQPQWKKNATDQECIQDQK